MLEEQGDVPALLPLQTNREVDKLKILNTIELLDMWAILGKIRCILDQYNPV